MPLRSQYREDVAEFREYVFVVVAADVCVEGFWLHRGDRLPEGLPGRAWRELLRSGSVQQVVKPTGSVVEVTQILPPLYSLVVCSYKE